MHHIPISSNTFSPSRLVCSSAGVQRALAVNIVELMGNQESIKAEWERAAKRNSCRRDARDSIVVVFGKEPMETLATTGSKTDACGVVMQFLASSTTFMSSLRGTGLGARPCLRNGVRVEPKIEGQGDTREKDTVRADGIVAAWLLLDVVVLGAEFKHAMPVLYVQLAWDDLPKVDCVSAYRSALQVTRVALLFMPEPFQTRIHVDFTGVLSPEHNVPGLESVRMVWSGLVGSLLLTAAVAPKEAVVPPFHPAGDYDRRVQSTGENVVDQLKPGHNHCGVGETFCKEECVRQQGWACSDGDRNAVVSDWLSTLLKGNEETTAAFGRAVQRKNGTRSVPTVSLHPASLGAAATSDTHDNLGRGVGVNGFGGDCDDKPVVKREACFLPSNTAKEEIHEVQPLQLKTESDEEVIAEWVPNGTINRSSVGDPFPQVPVITDGAACLFLETPSNSHLFPISDDIALRQLCVSWTALSTERRDRQRLIVVVADGDHRFSEVLRSWVRTAWNENAFILPIFAVGDTSFCRRVDKELASISACVNSLTDTSRDIHHFVRILAFAVQYFRIDVKSSGCLSRTAAFSEAANHVGVHAAGDYNCVKEWVDKFNETVDSLTPSDRANFDVERERDRLFDELCGTSMLARDLRSQACRPEMLMKHVGTMRVGIARPTICDDVSLSSTYPPRFNPDARPKLFGSLSPAQRLRIYEFMSAFFTKNVFNASVDAVRSAAEGYFSDCHFKILGYGRFALACSVRRHLYVMVHMNLQPLLNEDVKIGAGDPHWSSVFQHLSCTCKPRAHERILKTETGQKRCRHLAQSVYWLLQDIADDPHYALRMPVGAVRGADCHSRGVAHCHFTFNSSLCSKNMREDIPKPLGPPRKRHHFERNGDISITQLSALTEESDQFDVTVLELATNSRLASWLGVGS